MVLSHRVLQIEIGSASHDRLSYDSHSGSTIVEVALHFRHVPRFIDTKMDDETAKVVVAVVRVQRRSAGCRVDGAAPAAMELLLPSEAPLVSSPSLLAAARALSTAIDGMSGASEGIFDSSRSVLDSADAPRHTSDGDGGVEEEEEEVFSRDGDAFGLSRLEFGANRSPAKAAAATLEDPGIFFRPVDEHLKESSVMGVAMADPRSRKPFLVQQDVRFVLVVSNTPFHAHVRVKLQEAASRYFQSEMNESNTSSSSSSSAAAPSDELTALYKALAAPGAFAELPYRELFAGLPVVSLVRRIAKDLVAVLRVLLLEGRVVCFSSTPSLAASATLALLALLPGELSTTSSSFSSRTIQAVVYRLRRYGMPFALANKDFRLQPCFTSEQEDAVYAAKGFLVGTSNPLLLKHPRAHLDVIVNLDLGEVVAFPTKKTEFSFATGSEAAKLTSRILERFGGGSSSVPLRPPMMIKFLKPDAKTAPTRQESHTGAAMESIHTDIDWTLGQFQVYFEHFLQESYKRLVGRPSDSDASGRVNHGTLRSLLEDLTKPVFGEHAKFYAEFGRGWVHSWQKTSNYARWVSAHQFERRRSTVATPARPPQEGQACFTYPNGDEYDGLFQRGRRNGFGVYIEFATKNQYEGEWRDDKRHGKGVLSSKHLGYIYDGEWKDDVRCGHGHSSLKNVENYTGEWHDNCFHGAGIYTNGDGDVYDGEWHAGLREGAGKLTVAHPKRGEEFGGLKQYTGEWLEGKFHGTGTALYYDNTEYSGGFQDGKRHGNGMLSLASGDRYDGQWWKGYRHGEGSLYSAKSGDTREGTWKKDAEVDGVWFIVYQNGDKYTGECRRGRPWGEGVCKYANQSSYSGSWIDGLREGYGVCVNAEGAILEGEWKNSVYVKPARVAAKFVDIPLVARTASGRPAPPLRDPSVGDAIASRKRQLSTYSQEHPESGSHAHVYPNGDTYEGEFKGFLRDGFGVFTERATGNVYEGEWRQNVRQGAGVLTSGMKDFIYDGAWEQDVRSGYGHCVIRGCETYSGQWKNNQFHGVGTYIDAEGNVFDGEFVAGKKHGVGKQVFSTRPAKEQYSGEWKDGYRDGIGDAVFADGSTYSGSWRKDLRDGEGTFIAAAAVSSSPSSTSAAGASSNVSAGDKYVGQWRSGMRDGAGILSIATTGVVKEGFWSMDEPLDGEWTISFPDGSKFTGACVKGRPHGRGVCKYANGDLYDGQWAGGKRHGLGTGFFGNGESFVGEWENNHVALNGKGRLTLADGTVHVYAQ